MRIRWDPVQVMEATDLLEAYVNKIVKPLEQAKAAAEEATKSIPNLPDYVKYRFNSFAAEVERNVGKAYQVAGTNHVYQGALKSRIEEIRREVPKDALAEARAQPALLKIAKK